MSSSGFYSGDDAVSNDSECFSLANRTTAELSVHGFIVSAIILASLCGNGLVLLLVARYKQLRCRTVVVSLSVVAADLLITLSYSLPVLATTALQRWPFSEAGCTAFGYLSVQFLNARWLIMGILCLDRFCTVRFPYRYQRYSKCFLVTLTALAWGVPFVVGFPGLIDFGRSRLRENVPTCLPECNGVDRHCKIYYLVYTSVVYILGCIVPIGLYLWLYKKARKLGRATVTLGKMSVQVASGTITSKPITSLKKDSRENRASITFFIIFITILVTGTPPYLVALLRAVATDFHCLIPEMVLFLNTDLLLLSTALDPFVIIRDRDFRECIKTLFCCSAQTEDSSANPVPTPSQLASKRPSIASTIDDGQKARYSSVSSSTTVSSSSTSVTAPQDSSALLHGSVAQYLVPNRTVMQSLPEISEVFLEPTTTV